MIDRLVRENIKKLKPYTSARDQYESGILLDANENAFGSVVESDLNLNRYPDPKHKEIRNKLSEVTGISPAKLFVGVGSDEVIDLLIRIFCEPARDNILILQPTYGMYKVAADINNVESRDASLSAEFHISFSAIKKTRNKNTKIIFCCSPNNPTGNLLKRGDIQTLCENNNSIVVVDEAYIDFAEQGSVIKLVEKYENLIVTRTLSKAWGLAGIRAGYCAANELIIDYLYKVKAPYNLNKLTGNAIIEALDNYNGMKSLRDKILLEKELLISKLEKFKAVEKIFPSDANFILAKFTDAKLVFDKLVEMNIIIRDRSNVPGLDNCLRITIGTSEENEKLIEGLKEII